MVNYKQWVGLTAVLAGVLALVSLIVGLVGVAYDFEVFSDTSSLIAVGADAAPLIRWSYWLNMFGNYLLLVPLALFLYQWLRPEGQELARLSTVCGLFYVLLGAAGSAILAAAWPFLIESYDTAVLPPDTLLLQFQVVNAIAEEGLHGVVQNVTAVVWFLGIGSLLRAKHALLGTFTFLLGIFLTANTVGNLFAIEALSLLGLTANILLGPLWSIWLGIFLLRPKRESSQPPKNNQLQLVSPN